MKVKAELDRVQQKLGKVCYEVNSSICLKGLRKFMENLRTGILLGYISTQDLWDMEHKW
jgi:hypothetical protein